jgi:hypothetical protein
MKKSRVPKIESPSQMIGARIRQLDDLRGKKLSQIRAMIKTREGLLQNLIYT